MYFIKYQPLKEKLKNRALSEREALPYYVLFCALTAVLVSFAMPINELNKWDYLNGIVSLVATVIGTVYAFNKNGGNNGYDFIQKGVVLGWVVAFRLLIVFITVSFIVWAYTRTAGESTTWHDVVMGAVLEILYYQRLGRHLQDTNDKNRTILPITSSPTV